MIVASMSEHGQTSGREKMRMRAAAFKENFIVDMRGAERGQWGVQEEEETVC